MNNQEAENNRKVFEFITDNPCGNIATYGQDGRINMANVFAHIDTHFFLYIVSRPEHRKHANIQNHPPVSLLFTDKEGVAQAEYIGIAKTVEETKTVADMLPSIQKVLIEQKSEYWIPPVSQLEADGYVVIKIVPESIVYRSYVKNNAETHLEEISVILESSV